MKSFVLRLVATLVVLGFVSLCLADDVFAKDKVIKTYMAEGVYVGFEEGDYVHVKFRMSNGRISSYFSSDSVLKKLNNKVGKSFVITIRVVRTFIPEAGGTEDIEEVVAVKPL